MNKKSIHEQFNKGTTNTKIKDIHVTTPEQIRNKTRELLRPIVKDEQLLHILTEEQNIEKIKTRIENRFKVKDSKSGEILTIKSIANKTPNKAIQEIKNSIKKGEEIKDTKRNTLENIKKKGYQLEFNQSGKVHEIELEIIFRKG